MCEIEKKRPSLKIKYLKVIIRRNFFLQRLLKTIFLAKIEEKNQTKLVTTIHLILAHGGSVVIAPINVKQKIFRKIGNTKLSDLGTWRVLLNHKRVPVGCQLSITREREKK